MSFGLATSIRCVIRSLPIDPAFCEPPRGLHAIENQSQVEVSARGRTNHRELFASPDAHVRLADRQVHILAELTCHLGQFVMDRPQRPTLQLR